jgi:cob(I)alamin adenosyltransferase
MASHIYTKTGDDGTTGLFGGQRVSKADGRVEAYGTVDELNAVLGVARTHSRTMEFDAVLAGFQNLLFTLGSDLATPDPADTHKGKISVPRVTAEHVTPLEAAIDAWEAEMPPLTQFILPGGSPLAASLHHARTVCRRAERCCVSLAGQEPVNPEVIRYLNRLSDALFVLARLANYRQGLSDILWKQAE